MRTHLPGPAADEEYLARILIEAPWADPEIPSLVAVDDDDRVIGSISSEVRRMRHGSEEIHGVCCAHLVVAPESRSGATGALLLGALLKSGQDVTWSETASDDVVRIWQIYGGHADAARACDWLMVLRPAAFIRSVGTAAARRSLTRETLPVGAFPFHAIARGQMKSRVLDPGPGVTAEDADAGTIAAELPAVTRGLKVFVAHDEPYLASVFSNIERERGELVTRIVRRNGRAIGWYAYLPSSDRPSQALHICAARGEIGAVFDDLVRSAQARGAAALTGRLEPNLIVVLRQRLAIFGVARQPVIHAKDPALRAELGVSTALITRLDGEWLTT